MFSEPNEVFTHLYLYRSTSNYTVAEKLNLVINSSTAKCYFIAISKTCRTDARWELIGFFKMEVKHLFNSTIRRQISLLNCSVNVYAAVLYVSISLRLKVELLTRNRLIYEQIDIGVPQISWID